MIMQSIINVLAISSFLMSATAVGSGLYNYQNKDTLIDSFKQGLMENLLPGSAGLAGGGGALIPKDIPLALPTTPSLPIPSTGLPTGPLF